MRLRKLVPSISVAIAVSAIAVTPALASSSIYWANANANQPVSFASLSGSGGGSILGATGTNPFGVAFVTAAGKIFWTSSNATGTTNPNKIYYANIDGSSAAVLPTGSATVNDPEGLAIDPVGGRIFWANNHTGNPPYTISYAYLNGSGGADLPTGLATLDQPEGITVYPATGKVYWANFGASKISYANLNGSGGGDLPTGTANVSSPEGVAVDSATGKIYWSNFNAATATTMLSFANVNGSGGGGNLDATGATISIGAYGVALDHAAGRLYWTNSYSSTVSYANLNGSGGNDVATGTATVSSPSMPALLEVPSGTGAPVVSGGATSGTMLSCSPGTWSGDLVEALLYRAPQSFSYSWMLNGAPVIGATSNTLSASSGGQYACHVTATNYAGSTGQTSAARGVLPAIPTLKSKIKSAKHSAKFSFKTSGATGFQCALIKKKQHKKPKPKFGGCKSPKTYKHLKPGKYTFEVRGLSSAGPGVAATKSFKIG